jgi:Protein of unknown function (DUF2811)
MIEVPESLHQAFKSFLDRSPEWDQDRAMTAALSLFMMQQRACQVAPKFAEVPNAAWF